MNLQNQISRLSTAVLLALCRFALGLCWVLFPVSAPAGQPTNNAFLPLSSFQMRLQDLKDQQNASGIKLPARMPAFEIPPPPNLYASNLNFNYTNGPETEAWATNAITPDATEVYLLKKIDSIKHTLDNTNLYPAVRRTFLMELSLFRDQLIDHRTRVQMQIQNHLTMAGTSRTNTASIMTNAPDYIGQETMLSEANYEREAADPALPDNMRQMFARLAEERKRQLSEHEMAVHLWADLNAARVSKNAERISRAERVLADQLAARLGKIQGKTYPPGMSLDAVMGEYRKQIDRTHWFNPRTMSRTLVFLAILLPPAVLLIFAIKRRVNGRPA